MRYFFACVIFLYACSGLTQSSEPAAVNVTHAKPENPFFFGRIVYSAKASGSDEKGVDLFKAGAASKVEIWNRKDHFRMLETGGFFKANVLASLKDQNAYWLNPEKKEALQCGYVNLDEVDAGVKAFMPKFYTPPQLEPTGEKETILGKECKKYTIGNSPILKAGSTGSVWLWEEKDYPPSRLEFETEWKKTTTPLPLNVFQPHGLVLKMEVKEGEVNVTYMAEELEEKEISAGMFQVPQGFKIIEQEK